MAVPDPVLTIGVLDSIKDVLVSAVDGGWIALYPGAKTLLRHMALAEMSLMTAGMIFARSEAWMRLLMAGLKFGFYFMLFLNLRLITEAFLNTVVAGGLAIGFNPSFTAEMFAQPSMIVSLGLEHTKAMVTYVESLKGTYASIKNLPVILMYSAFLQVAQGCYLLIGLHQLIATVEFKMICVMGLMLLPWGIFTHTAWIAEGVIGGITSAAVRLLALATVTSITHKVLTHPKLQLATAVTDPTWNTALAMLGMALVLGIMSWVVPNFAASLVGNGPAMTGTSLVRGTLGVVAAGAAGGRTVLRQVGQMRRRAA